MKIRSGVIADGSGNARAWLAPMIDIAFLLLIFFLLTLKMIRPEGHFDVRMPIGDVDPEPPLLIKVRLTSNEDGSLQQVYFGRRPLGRESPACFERLNNTIAGLVGNEGQFNDVVNVEIDAAYDLDYEYTIKAVASCLAWIDPVTGQRVPLVSNIRFRPAQRPGASAALP